MIRLHNVWRKLTFLPVSCGIYLRFYTDYTDYFTFIALRSSFIRPHSCCRRFYCLITHHFLSEMGKGLFFVFFYTSAAVDRCVPIEIRISSHTPHPISMCVCGQKVLRRDISLSSRFFLRFICSDAINSTGGTRKRDLEKFLINPIKQRYGP